MQDAAPKAVRLADYAPPDFMIDTVDLDFTLDPAATRVRSRMSVRRNPAGRPDAPLVLDGEALTLERLALDGVALHGNRYQCAAKTLTIADLPDHFVLEIDTLIAPKDNTELSGLYVSGGNFFTQCEAEGFRRITYFPDRPDVMARFTTTIHADRAAVPVMLSNGNPQPVTVDGVRHTARWVDPHPKPSYLFALVAGDLVSVDDAFTTRSGRRVALHIWVRRGDQDRCDHAMRSLKRAMAWDEAVFGLEYDLDVFNIAAVSDFNMGAMENKGLNVFNTKYVLARPDTATDGDYQGIESVVAHEYFHNWTGNRITCRDWFQLSLKEGLTVFRDQEFSADQGSRAVKRITDVRGLRAGQFSEDAGPLAHPVRPESYIAIDNFYTATVYQKGAEVVRMIQTIIGRAAFRKGMDLYVARHDNQAVTIEDFVRCMQDASGVDLAQLSLWYAQAGTPEVFVSETFDAAARRYALTLRQSVPPTPSQPDKRPMPIPIAMGLLAPDGTEVATRMLMLTTAEETFVFDDMAARPTPSLLRGFSAPVKLRNLDAAATRFLAIHDTDPFVRCDSLQQYASGVILDLVAASRRAEALRVAADLIEAYRTTLTTTENDPHYAALMMALPPEAVLGDAMVVDDVDAIAVVRRLVSAARSTALAPDLWRIYRTLAACDEAHEIAGPAIGRRALKNTCLALLAHVEGAAQDEVVAAACDQFEGAENMTDRLAALSVLNDIDCPERGLALAAFYEAWRDDALVLDKWFAVQAMTALPSALEDVRALAVHPDFDIGNPNRVRALVGSFATNRVAFHAADGAGYRFLADTILALDPRNSQLAARMVPPLGKWRRFEAARQALMRGELSRILDQPGLSRGTHEMVSRSIA